MNRAQRILLISVAFLSLLIGLFPPWRYDILSGHYHKQIGFHFLFSDPYLVSTDSNYYFDAHIDTTKLAVEWVIVVLVSVPLFFVLKNPPRT